MGKVNTEFLHGSKPESLRLFHGSHVLIVTSFGAVCQGEIMKTIEQTENREPQRYMIVKLKAMGQYVYKDAKDNGGEPTPGAAVAALTDFVKGA